jgi:activator of HSP90 ATPase
VESRIITVRGDPVPTSIHQVVTFKATPQRVYRALMNSKEHEAFTANGKAKISSRVGGTFSAHGGYVIGRNIELKPGKRIVQAWRVKGMPESVYSIVRFEFKKVRGGTRLIFDQTGLPPKHVGHLSSGWKARYWRPLKAYLEKPR